jgi:hypothetical protein
MTSPAASIFKSKSMAQEFQEQQMPYTIWFYDGEDRMSDVSKWYCLLSVSSTKENWKIQRR